MPADPAADGAPLREQLAALLHEHRLLIERLQEGQDHFRRLARSVWRVQEDERRRIAHELHDGLGHDVTALIHLLGAALAALPPGDAAAGARRHLERARAVAESALQDTRSLSRLLRPQVLDDLGLEQALRWLARTFGETHAIAVKLALGDGLDALDGERRTLVFRIAQEALANAARHAGAREIGLAAGCRHGEVRLEVRDDGRGADPARALASSGEGASSGLGGMRDRVRLFGGGLRIESAPGAGFALVVRFPARDAEAPPA